MHTGTTSSQLNGSLNSQKQNADMLHGGLGTAPVRGSKSLEALTSHLGRLARFGANIVDAHACIILLPESCLSAMQLSPSSRAGQPGSSKRLKLSAFHSLSDVIDASATISIGEGLIGWVGQHGKPVHLSPFEKDSRTLGVYRADCSIMSFIGVPLPIAGHGLGVITCDSLKPGAFTVLHSHLLHDFATEVSSAVELHLSTAKSEPPHPWVAFKRDAQALITALGTKTISLMRLSPANYQEIERAVGMSNAIEMAEQLFRLFQQALPPHFPVVRLPNGEVVVMLDRMMTSFYESKLTAVMRHVQYKGHTLQYAISNQSLTESAVATSSSQHEPVMLQRRAV
jgi:hypothetical protein